MKSFFFRQSTFKLLLQILFFSSLFSRAKNSSTLKIYARNVRFFRSLARRWRLVEKFYVFFYMKCTHNLSEDVFFFFFVSPRFALGYKHTEHVQFSNFASAFSCFLFFSVASFVVLLITIVVYIFLGVHQHTLAVQLCRVLCTFCLARTTLVPLIRF